MLINPGDFPGSVGGSVFLSFVLATVLLPIVCAGMPTGKDKLYVGCIVREDIQPSSNF